MKLHRHIAFLAVLVASAVMFVHAVVPHHHRASDLAMCTEAPAPCHHSSDVQQMPLSETVFDADCDCACNGVKCTPALPFTLRYGVSPVSGDNPSSPNLHDGTLLPLFVFLACTNDLLLLSGPQLSLSNGPFLSDDARPITACVLGCLLRRGPPVL